MDKKRTALIIGAGPAGLTTAFELLQRTDIHPIVFEVSDQVGGISKTINYKGNRIDIGGHRFFSKSNRVMQWWNSILPLETGASAETEISYQNKSRELGNGQSEHRADPTLTEGVMLVRNRLSRIYFLRKFFNYPITLDFNLARNLGVWRILHIGLSYLRAKLFPVKNEKSLADFFKNRFGYVLYRTFFRDYTEKVWGVPCDKIPASWGAQRIKGLSIQKAIWHAFKKLIRLAPQLSTVEQKGTETSLIEKFLYPKLGPGQMWEEVANRVGEKRGEILMHHAVTGIIKSGERILGLEVKNAETGEVKTYSGDFVFSTMPIRDLIRAMDTPQAALPAQIKEISEGLVYRDFITVGLLVKSLSIADADLKGRACSVRDNWIYIQEPDVKLGRLQIFNNWSPYLVKDPGTVWLGLEYFCQEGDDLWTTSDEDLKKLGEKELVDIGILREGEVLDGVAIRVPKTYPAYFGTYDRFHILKSYIDGIDNLYLLGRNGMHRYNNQDHSMLTAMTAVDNIIQGIRGKENIWEVNTEMEYHEEKAVPERKRTLVPQHAPSPAPL